MSLDTLTSEPTVTTRENDERIVAAFKKTYVYQTYLATDTVHVAADHGVVTLTGTVALPLHKALAQATMAHLPGVVRVDNELVTKAEVAADHADLWIGGKVRLTLLFHRHVNASQTGVDVRDGVVTLTGEATSLAQKELTAAYANDIEGVLLVKNEMTVAATLLPPPRTPGEQMDDASIAAHVTTALLTHRSTSSVTTRVEVRAGVVTLTGIARNATEIALVNKLVNDIHGVSSVQNEMTVAVAA